MAIPIGHLSKEASLQVHDSILIAELKHVSQQSQPSEVLTPSSPSSSLSKSRTLLTGLMTFPFN